MNNKNNILIFVSLVLFHFSMVLLSSADTPISSANTPRKVRRVAKLQHGSAPAAAQAVDVAELNKELHVRAQSGDIRGVISLLNQGAQINNLNRDDENILFTAIKMGHTELAKYLIRYANDRGLNLDQRNKLGMEIIHVAAAQGNRDIIQYLLDFKDIDINRQTGRPDINIRLADKTPLHFAVENNHHHIVRILLRAGANRFAIDRNNKIPEEYGTPVMSQEIQRVKDEQAKQARLEEESRLRYLMLKRDAMARSEHRETRYRHNIAQHEMKQRAALLESFANQPKDRTQAAQYE